MCQWLAPVDKAYIITELTFTRIVSRLYFLTEFILGLFAKYKFLIYVSYAHQRADMPAQCVYVSNLSSGSVFYCEISSDSFKDQRISRA